jgi:hypothetical protein
MTEHEAEKEVLREKLGAREKGVAPEGHAPHPQPR